MTSRQPRSAVRVLVLTLSFGSGHGRAATAVAAKLRALSPDADVRVIDALDRAAFWFRAVYVWPYWVMLRRAPGLWRRLFDARLRNGSRHTAPEWTFRHGCARTLDEIAAFRPDVIVAAEVGAGEIAAIARRRGLTNAPIASVITDHHAEPAWVAPEVTAYVVADDSVRDQLLSWGARASQISVCGIPTDSRFEDLLDTNSVRARYGCAADVPLVLLMGGGMGPSRMDLVAAGLCASGRAMHVVAVAGHDARVRRRLDRVRATPSASLTVCGWVDDVPALMRSAAVLVTKPGGLTTAEAAICGLPTVLFDPIPGPEERNALRLVDAGAGVLTRETVQTTAAVCSILDDTARHRAMASEATRLATRSAAESAARVILDRAASGDRPPVLIMTIRNGAGHTAVAEAIAEAIESGDPDLPVRIVDTAGYMSPLLHATHVTLFLWLVKYAPRFWERIDTFQKMQLQTSPDWYYRRGCRRLLDLVNALNPRAIVATEVGCCEMAALIKRDLRLSCPLVAVNGEYDADRAWLQPEVTAYSVPDETVRAELSAQGGDPDLVHAWGVPIARRFAERPRDSMAVRASVCADLGLATDSPVVLVSGGSEGVDRVAERLLRLTRPRDHGPQVIVLAGRNAALRRRCDALANSLGGERLRVLGWTTDVRPLMQAADLLVGKLGHTFDEAVATRLPIVALEPPPGSERAQHRQLDGWGVGRAVRGLDQMAQVVERLLTGGSELNAMRTAADRWEGRDAAGAIARWLSEATRPLAAAERRQPERTPVAASPLAAVGQWR
jgi:processive 1,2-diacylglycerol beta-glucosyltransferase